MNIRTTRVGAAVFMAAAGVLAALTIPVSNQTQASGSAPVTVVNTPLAVALQGTGGNAGNVNAAQNGAWNVGVTSLPAVQLAPGTTIAVSGGSLAVEDPARRAIAVTLCASFYDDCGDTPSVTSFPISTRFVIEYTAGTCSVRNTGIQGWELKARLNGQDNLYQVSDKLSAHDDESATGLFSNPMRVYVDGGVPNGVSVDLLDAGFSESHDLGPFAYCTITLSGHLVDMPATFPTAP